MLRYRQEAKRTIQQLQASNRQTIDKVGHSLLSASSKSLATALLDLKDMACSPFVLKSIVLGIEEFRWIGMDIADICIRMCACRAVCNHECTNAFRHVCRHVTSSVTSG